MWGIVAPADAPEGAQHNGTQGGKPDGQETGWRVAQVAACTNCLFADFANANHNVRFNWAAAPPTFDSVRVGDLENVKGTWLSGGGAAGSSKLF